MSRMLDQAEGTGLSAAQSGLLRRLVWLSNDDLTKPVTLSGDRVALLAAGRGRAEVFGSSVEVAAAVVELPWGAGPDATRTLARSLVDAGTIEVADVPVDPANPNGPRVNSYLPRVPPHWVESFERHRDAQQALSEGRGVVRRRRSSPAAGRPTSSAPPGVEAGLPGPRIPTPAQQRKIQAAAERRAGIDLGNEVHEATPVGGPAAARAALRRADRRARDGPGTDRG